MISSLTASAPARLALAALAACSFAPALAAQDICEDNGLIVMEIERAPAVSSWQVETAIGGYTGDSYYRWSGSNQFNNPGVGVLSYTFEVETAGEYQLRIRNYHDDPDATMNNDCWSRMDGGEWTKTYSKFKDAWVWSTRFDHEDEPNEDAYYDLTVGTHTLELSARSNGFHMDRIHLYLDGTPDAENEGLPETTCFEVFTNLGHALAGVSGLPKQLVSGTLMPNDNVHYRLQNAAPNSVAFFVFGFANISAGFKGGVLVPSPDLVLPVPTTPTGGVYFNFPWPFNSVPGLFVYSQFWVQDAVGPAGFSASNAVQHLTQ